jgi:hypothetical protein
MGVNGNHCARCKMDGHQQKLNKQKNNKNNNNILKGKKGKKNKLSFVPDT